MQHQVHSQMACKRLSVPAGYIPSTLGVATGLTTLWLENNRLSGSIPADVASLPQLQSIRLYNNSLSGSASHAMLLTPLIVLTLSITCKMTHRKPPYRLVSLGLESCFMRDQVKEKRAET